MNTDAASILEVRNSRSEAPRVVLFGQLADGKFVARRLDEDQVPYTEAWPGTLAQVMVYIEPDDAQLERIVTALKDGRLDFERLQEFGGLDGGVSQFPV
jgi:hypothetical protein